MDTKICFQSMFASDIYSVVFLPSVYEVCIVASRYIFLKSETDTLVNHFSFSPLTLSCVLSTCLLFVRLMLFSLSHFLPCMH